MAESNNLHAINNANIVRSYGWSMSMDVLDQIPRYKMFGGTQLYREYA